MSLQNQGRLLPQTKNEHLEDAIPEQFQTTIRGNFALQLLFELVKEGPLLQPRVVHCVSAHTSDQMWVHLSGKPVLWTDLNQ